MIQYHSYKSAPVKVEVELAFFLLISDIDFGFINTISGNGFFLGDEYYG